MLASSCKPEGESCGGKHSGEEIISGGEGVATMVREKNVDICAICIGRIILLAACWCFIFLR